jgi:cell division protein FtsW
VTRLQTEKHQPDYTLYFTVVILTAIGILTVYSASSVIALHNGKPAYYFAIRQLISALIGLVAMTALMYIPFHKLYKWAPLLLLGNFGLLVAVLIPGIGKVVNGGRRWIGTSSVHLQPSELAIIFTTVYLAFFFTKKVTVLDSFKRGFRPALIIVSINFLLILLEPDMGTGLTLVGTSMAIVFASGIPLKRLLGLLAVGIPAIIGLTFAESYRSSRMLVFLHLFSSPPDKSYQILQGLTAITSGGWFGRGFGMSIEKTGYLPEAYTDFIYTVFVEEWGIVGGVTLILIFAFLIWRGFMVARSSSSRFGALLAVGLTSMIAIKAIINLGAVTALLPVTGIPLPFISYGGTSIIVNLAAMGVLLSISRNTLDVEPEVDHLADVVPVEEVIGQRNRDHSSTPIFEPSAPRKRRTGVVHPLRTKTARTSESGLSWRARQETAATRHLTDRRQNSSTTSWRERNRQLDPWQSKHTRSKRDNRKDR